jgi:hypothetical protein
VAAGSNQISHEGKKLFLTFVEPRKEGIEHFQMHIYDALVSYDEVIYDSYLGDNCILFENLIGAN